MRSSASTPNPRSGPIPLGIVLVGDDHPRACTGRRLIRLGLATELADRHPHRRGGVVLDPYALVPLSRRDLPRACAEGLIAVDRSWNALSAVRARSAPAARPATEASHRRLPMLLAANPQHFGRLGELNTVEALAAALWVLGRRGQAEGLLSGFAGGRAFWQVNGDRLARYAHATSPEAVVAVERELFRSV